jgi:RNA polymerase sigma-70 factor (ECF subfamily)
MATLYHPTKTLPDHDSDAQLMLQVRARKQWALDILYDRYLMRGIRHARRSGLDTQTAEDIVAEAFLKIWFQAEKFQCARGTFSGWFHTIVHNLAIDEIRRLQSRTNAQLKSYLDKAPNEQADDENELMHALEQIQVRAALAELPESQRDLLELAYVEGLSRREIAKRMALPLGTVHTRVRLGKEKLKRILQEPSMTMRYSAT